MFIWFRITVILAVLCLGFISYIITFNNLSIFGLDKGFTLKDPPPLKLAFLNPTFTYAAYQNNSFYNFYSKYYSLAGPHTNITTDLDLIKDKKVPHAPFYLYDQLPGHPPGIPHKYLIDRVIDTVTLLAPTSNLTFINDQHVDAGNIFDSNGRNNLDVIFLVHEEYVTQQEYNNLKKFVAQGGTLVFVESNILTVEVNYDRQNDTISLVKGHEFEFDGKVARRSVEERWLNETSQWVGSNFLPKFDEAYFKDMPFNYTHTEEQYISNPNATVLYDYKIFDPLDPKLNDTVATYVMKYGKGKVIMTSLFADKLDSDREFFKFFRTILLPRALGSTYKVSLNGSSYDIYDISYNSSGSFVSLDPPGDITIHRNQTNDITGMILNVPKQIMLIPEHVKPADLHYSVTIDGNNNTDYNVMPIQNEVGFELPIHNDTKLIKISATIDPSLFNLTAPPSLAVTAQGPLTTISNLGKPTIGGKTDPSLIKISNNAPAKFPLGITVVKWRAEDAYGHSASDLQVVHVIDKNFPIINITFPKDRTLVPTTDGKVVINGTSFDNEGIRKVEVQIQSELAKKTFPYKDAIPGGNWTSRNPYINAIPGANWTSWYMPLEVQDLVNPILITARVTDVSGHQSWDRVAFATRVTK